MKKVCRNVTIPADLQEELSLVRRDVNVSQVCTEALQRAVGQEPKFEDTRDKLVKRLTDENKKLHGLLKQVRRQRDAAQRKLDKFIAGSKMSTTTDKLNTNTIPKEVRAQLEWDANVFGTGFAEQMENSKWRQVDPTRVVVQKCVLDKGREPLGIPLLVPKDTENVG